MISRFIDISATQSVWLALLISLFAFFLLWLAQLRKPDLGILDIYWGPGFAVIALLHLSTRQDVPTQAVTLTALFTVVWGLRLGWYLWSRHQLSSGEDRRYARMRANGGPDFWWKSLFKICFLQGFLMWAIATPQHIGILSTTPVTSAFGTFCFIVGIVLFVAGSTFEATADFQLHTFRKDPKNRGLTMRYGLWRYSRHPNYFGEAMLWWGLGLIAFSASGSAFVFFGPSLITFLLLKVSGVSMLESHLADEKVGYRDYVKQTSAFIPWPPREKE